MQKNYYIVGTKIKNQLRMANMVAYDEFINLLGNKNNEIENIEFSIGQGLSRQQINTIALIAKKNRDYNCKFSESCNIGLQFSSQLVHKCNIQNIMVSIPEQSGERAYTSYLLIDEECAEMSDHITGLHIQGMVLLEAARQMVSAVSEKFLVQDKQCNYFILNKIEAIFYQYIFPIEVKILHKIIDIRYGLRGAYAAKSEINFMQNGVIALTVKIEHQAMDSVVMHSYESSLAIKSIESNFSKRKFHETK